MPGESIRNQKVFSGMIALHFAFRLPSHVSTECCRSLSILE
jgi:hypothetical protein